MMERIDIAPPHREPFGNPAPLGLLGLAIACFALFPVSFSHEITTMTLKTATVYALLFGACCQLLAGLMDFANRNTFGGAIFTTFSFLWMKNGWEFYSLSKGFVPDPHITFAVDIMLLVIFVVLAYGFGHFSLTLFLFLVDIDLLYVCKIIDHATHSHIMAVPIGVLTGLLGLIALWLAFGALLNPVAGRELFRQMAPLFSGKKKVYFDFSLRNAIFAVLYDHWKAHAFLPMSREELEKKLQEKAPGRVIKPDLFYLMEYGALVLTHGGDETEIKDVRLSAKGIDIYEQLILGKYEF
jgi:succinate-acetate transporter protein